jgi:hypothetical protein
LWLRRWTALRMEDMIVVVIASVSQLRFCDLLLSKRLDK